MMVDAAPARPAACAQAAAAPAGSAAAAASAARSAPAWARWRATTAEPTAAAATVIASSTVTNTAPRTVAEPRSPEHSRRRFDGRDRVGADGESGHEWRVDRDGGDHEIALPTHSQYRAPRRDTSHSEAGRCVISACGQSGRFPGGVDASDLSADRRESADAEHQHRHQRGHRQCRLHGPEPGVTRQTLVLSARAMMPDNAPTMESPVTTV